MSIKEIKEKIKYLWGKAFVRDVAILQFGSFFSTGLTVLASVVFARVLGADNYGVYALVFAFTGLVEMFMNVGANYMTLTLLAEAYAKKDFREAKNVLTYFMRITLGIDLLAGGLGIIFAPYFTNLLYGNPQIGVYARVVLGSIIIKVFFSLLTEVLHATRRIASLTIYENLHKLFIKFLPILFVLMGMGVFGIVFGHFVTGAIFLALAIIYYRKLAAKDSLLPSFSEIFFNKEKVPMWRYFKFGFQIAIDKNLSGLYSTLSLTFLGMYVATASIATFKVGLSYISIPIILVGPVSRILNVQLPKSKVISKDLLKEHFVKTALFSGLIACLLIVPFILLAPFLVRLFYGAEFMPAVRISYYLAIYAIIQSFWVGLGPIYRVMYKMKSSIIINGISVAIGAPLAYLAIKSYGINGMIGTTILWQNIASTMAFFYAIKILNKEIVREKR